jgi:hypothetical protein
MSEQEWKDQMLDLTGELYEDQFALIVFGEAEPCDEDERVEVNAAGTIVMPDCCTHEMLVSAIAELMAQEPAVRDVINAAVSRYDEKNRPPQICLN